MKKWIFMLVALWPVAAEAGLPISLTVTMNEAVTVTGTPRVAVDVGGVTRYATYTSGSGTSALTFTLTPQAGDVDLDGIAVSSPVDLNGGTITDLSGNALAVLTFTPPNTSGIKVNYPSLGMDFVYDADGRYTLNGTVYNDLTSFLTAASGTFTRASTATYFDSTGTLQTAAANAPRFDYDPVTHAAKGILIEGSRTNHLSKSHQFDDAAWTKSFATVIQNAAIAPDGTLAADMLVASIDSNNHGVSVSNFSVSAGSQWSTSIYAKAAGNNYAYLWLDNGGGFGITLECHLSTGVIRNTRVSTMYYTNVSTSCTDVGNGWWRMAVSATTSLTSIQTRFYISPTSWVSSNFGTPISAGDGVSGAYIWGAQLEQGAFPTTYIPTTTAPLARMADVLRISTSGWLNSSEGTLYAVSHKMSDAFAGIASIDDGGSTNVSHHLYQPSGTALVAETINAGTTRQIGPQTVALGAQNKSAFSAKLSSFALSSNGQVPLLSGAVQGLPAVSWLYVGVDRWHGNYINGYIRGLKYYPTRLSDTQLQLLTQ